MANNIGQLQKRLGYQFRDPDLLILALSHRSVASKNNERLEFLGDAILGLVVTDFLYREFPDAREGDLSRMRSHIVRGESLAEVAKQLALGPDLLLGSGEMKSGGHRRDSILGDTIEALIGAIYLHAGLATTATVVRKLIDATLTQAMARGAGLDGKTALQELTAQLGKGAPEYIVTETGPDHDKSFSADAMVAGDCIASGSGKSKREAEQVAARSAYDILKPQVVDEGSER